MIDTNAILSELEYIERQNDVRILFACESGSRAWGFASPDSDYDVRFVYVRPISDYLSLRSRRDTVEWSISLDGTDFDSSGWDLAKFVRLLAKSNPSAIEWLGSPIVYREDSRFWEVERLRDACFDPVSSAWHYYGMLKKHDERYLHDNLVVVKKYLYMLRGILGAKWSISRFTPVPIPFGMLVNEVLPDMLATQVFELLEIKRSATESQKIEHIKALDDYILANLEALPAEIGRHRHREGPNIDDLDEIYRRVMGWS